MRRHYNLQCVHVRNGKRGRGDPNARALTPSRPLLRAYDEPKLGASGPFDGLTLTCVVESEIAAPLRSRATLFRLHI
jgi:hypothetical protein